MSSLQMSVSSAATIPTHPVCMVGSGNGRCLARMEPGERLLRLALGRVRRQPLLARVLVVCSVRWRRQVPAQPSMPC